MCEDYPCCGHEAGDCEGQKYGSDESRSTEMARAEWQVLSDLEYYLGYRPDDETVAEAMDYLERGGVDLAAWVDDMVQIGAL